MFNLDESLISFRNVELKNLRKSVGLRTKPLLNSVASTKRNLDRVTAMPIFNTAGDSYTPIIVYPGKQPHFRRLNGIVQTLHIFLPKNMFSNAIQPELIEGYFSAGRNILYKKLLCCEKEGIFRF